MGKFSDLDLDRELDEDDCFSERWPTNGVRAPSDVDQLKMQIEYALSELGGMISGLERLVDRAKYYNEPPTIEALNLTKEVAIYIRRILQ